MPRRGSWLGSGGSAAGAREGAVTRHPARSGRRPGAAAAWTSPGVGCSGQAQLRDAEGQAKGVGHDAVRGEARRSAVGERGDPDAVAMDRDRVLPVRRHAAVDGRDRPLVLVHEGLGAAGGDHRLDGDDQPGLHLGAALAHAVVEDRRGLVHRAADAVADVVGEDPVDAAGPLGLVLDVLLDRRADLVEVAGGGERRDAAPERRPRSLGTARRAPRPRRDVRGRASTIVIAESPFQPSISAPLSMETMSPARSTRSPGIPCTTSSSTDAQIVWR